MSGAIPDIEIEKVIIVKGDNKYNLSREGEGEKFLKGIDNHVA